MVKIWTVSGIDDAGKNLGLYSPANGERGMDCVLK
jgi:hypothetical protein